MYLKLFAVWSKHNIIAKVQTAYVYTSQGRFLPNNGRRRLLADR